MFLKTSWNCYGCLQFDLYYFLDMQICFPFCMVFICDILSLSFLYSILCTYQSAFFEMLMLCVDWNKVANEGDLGKSNISWYWNCCWCICCHFRASIIAITAASAIIADVDIVISLFSFIIFIPYVIRYCISTANSYENAFTKEEWLCSDTLPLSSPSRTRLKRKVIKKWISHVISVNTQSSRGRRRTF